MAYLNMRGLDDLWARIGEVFGRRTQAAGNQTLNGTVLALVAIDGNQLASIDLNDTFATDQELSDMKTELEQAISDGTSGMLTRSAADGRYARSFTYVSSSKQLTLRDGNGNALSTVTID